jgi:hypothetical protein
LDWKAAGYVFPTEDDHVWCELDQGCVVLTNDPPTLQITADELLARFRAASGAWDTEAAAVRLGLDATDQTADQGCSDGSQNDRG